MIFSIQSIEQFIDKHERKVSSLALVGGFIFDSLTLRRVDLLFENLIILSYLVVSGLSIVLLNYYKEYPPIKSFTTRVQKFLPLFIQFSFGGLFSAFFIFYFRSAAFTSSWPFLLILLFLLVGNEFFKERYERLTFLASVYFVAIFSFSILIVPVVLKKMSAGIFLLSGILSIVAMSIFTRVLLRVLSKRYERSRVDINRMILLIYVAINILYFTNLIPPIPLALNDSGAYHSVVKVENGYQVVGEKLEWYKKIPFYPETLHIKEGESAYVFSAIFAPTDLATNVVHEWEYLDPSSGDWVSATRISFDIVGGRGEGYRTFSKKENIFTGKWRVDVKTQRGQTIGRVRFNVEIVGFQPVLEEKVL